MSKYKLNKGFIEQELEGKTVIFDPEGSILFTLNVTGHLIFTEIKKGSTTLEITKKLVKSYNITSKQAHADVTDFVNKLKNRKIIST